MRRKEKAVTDPAAIEAIIDDAQVCHLAMCDRTGPYVVPLCFGYRQGVFYFHSAGEGRKLDILDTNPKVCVALETEISLKTGATPCKWGMGFRSVIAFGTVGRITDPADKRAALDVIMNHYGTGPWTYSAKALEATVVLRMTVDHMTAKRS